MLGQRAADGGGHLRLDPRRRRRGRRGRWRAGRPCPRFRCAAGRRAAWRSGRRRASPTWRGCAGRGAAPPPRRARSASARSLSRLRSWTSSNSTAATPFEFGIGLDARQEDAVGHGDHPRRLADLAVEAGGIADGRARLLAALARHEFGGGAGGEAARDEQQDLAAVRPGLVEQRRRDPRRLAGAGRRDQQRARAVARARRAGRAARLERGIRSRLRSCPGSGQGASRML